MLLVAERVLDAVNGASGGEVVGEAGVPEVMPRKLSRLCACDLSRIHYLHNYGSTI